MQQDARTPWWKVGRREEDDAKDDSWHAELATRARDTVTKWYKAIDSERQNDRDVVTAYYLTDSFLTEEQEESGIVPGEFTHANALRGAINTAASMVVRAPEVTILPTAASWDSGIAAKKASRLASGLLHAVGMRAIAHRVFIDAATMQLGASKWWVDEDSELRCERVLPHTLRWNPRGGANPKELGQVHGVPRLEVMEAFDLDEETADRLPAYKPDVDFEVYTTENLTDDVEVVELWRLGSEAKPGRHVITSGDVVLLDEEWKHDFFPVVLYRWSDAYDGAGGVSLGKELKPYQDELLRYARDIAENAAKSCKTQTWLEKGSEVLADDIKNEEGAVGYFVGQAPVVKQGVPLPPQFYASQETIKADMLGLAGISYSQATATKPTGLNSGEAQRVHADLGQTRLLPYAQTCEDWYKRNVTVSLALAADAYASKDKQIKAPGTRWLEEIAWKDVAGFAREAKYEVRVYTTASLPTDPAGRAEAIYERVEVGALTPRRARRLQASPDLATSDDRETAAEELAIMQVEKALMDGTVPVPPDPLQGAEGLGLIVEVGTQEYLLGLTRKAQGVKVPEAHLQCLAQLIQQAKAELEKLAPPPAPANDQGAAPA